MGALELRSVGLGCMRLSTEPESDEQTAAATLHAALQAGVTLLDTAPSYCRGEGREHENERLIARVLAESGPDSGNVRVGTKAGIVRRGTGWVPDGRASSLERSCEQSLVALGKSVHDLFSLHAPDPRVPLATSLRALARLQKAGLVRQVGLCNVSLSELERAADEVDVACVQVALGAFDDDAFRSGLVRKALDLGIEIHAHSPLGGPKRARRLARDRELVRLSEKYRTSPAAIVLAWLYGLDPRLTLLPGARRPESARTAVEAATLCLDDDNRALIDRRFETGRPCVRAHRSHPRPSGGR